MIPYKRHLNYLKFVTKHKFFVFIAGLKTKAPLWNLLIHDFSKFSPKEWMAYSSAFYAENGDRRYKESPKFNHAWLCHQKSNPHHWQYWVLVKDSGEITQTEMPEKYVREMFADWMGAGRTIFGRWEVREWFSKNNSKMILHENTRRLIDKIFIEVFDD